jgi:hypothetical protein
MSLKASLDDKTIVTQVYSKEDAEEIYKYAMDHGDTAVKAERKKLEDSLTIVLGNLPPNKEC